jgi:3-hydroxymyristoyl/3-hydroxydecanoyl-(acyl carrier protein) dehydratase
MVEPGDQLMVEIHFLQKLGELGKVKGQAFVKDRKVAEAEIAYRFERISQRTE